MSATETGRAAAQVAILATEAAGVALASGAAEPAVVLAGTCVAAMSRIQKQLIERHGVVETTRLLLGLLDRDVSPLIVGDERELIDEVRRWGRTEDELGVSAIGVRR